ncbi:MAG: glycogen synthase [Ignavibacterium sp.]
MARKIKVLFVTSELFPFVKTGGLADVSSALPQTLTSLGHEVRIMVPKYGAIDLRKYKIHDILRLKELTTKIGDKEVTYALKSSFLPVQKIRIQIYFLENDEFYGNRKSLYIDPITGTDYKDNDERFIFFAKTVFELIDKLSWVPDIIHCNDWQCGLIPAYHKTIFKNDHIFSKIKTLFTIHNFSAQGIFPISSFEKTGLPEKLKSENGIVHQGKINFMKSGIMFADCVNTVSEGYAKEIIKDSNLSNGLNTVLQKRKNKIYGIINGIDTNVWNPEKDKFITKNYSLKNFENKIVNKKILLERFGLKFDDNIPVIGTISRLYESKGTDLLIDSFDELMKLNLQFILLGTGERKYQIAFEKFSKKYSDKFVCYLGFNDELSHQIEAGVDMFLIPSKYEPCGLNQMYSLFYGTVPIVRETGGLSDIVVRFNEKTEEGNGFMFKDYKSAAMISEVKRALKFYQDKKIWNKIIRNGMRSDFSWVNSAKKYIDLYKEMLSD